MHAEFYFESLKPGNHLERSIFKREFNAKSRPRKTGCKYVNRIEMAHNQV
jgi:hypothetical protein